MFPFKKFDISSNKPISFVGDINKADRFQLINNLEAKGILIDVYKNISHTKMCEVFSKSFISLNFTKTHYNNNSEFHPLYQLKGRPTEIALSNGFCVSDMNLQINQQEINCL